MAFLNWALALLYLTALSKTLETPPTVKVSEGVLRGKIEESAVGRRKYAAFTSIPYAKPPVAEGRFKEPVPIEPWIGTYDATRDAPMCAQHNHLVASRTPPVSGSEDCLYLNVYTPKLTDGPGSELLDVIFHIHGGGFTALSSVEYSPKRVLDRDVVFVSINYRLGTLGFLSTQDSIVPGNNGLKDQLLALKWVKNNIAAFGGDPNKITLSGMSAGSASVHMHILSSQSKGLFQRAIMESGSCPASWTIVENPVEQAHRLATLLGCPSSPTKEMIDCLRQRPADHLVMASSGMVFAFGPTIEPPSSTAFLTKHPLQIIVDNEAQDVPMLLSFATDEAILLLGDKLIELKLLAHPDKFWKILVSKMLDFNNKIPADVKSMISSSIEEQYFGGQKTAINVRQFFNVFSDWTVVAPMIQAAKLHAHLNKSPVYVFEFGYKGTRRSSDPYLPRDVYDGVNHGEHSLYVIPVPEMLDLHPDDQPMATTLLDLYMTFIQGKPMPGDWKTVQEGLPKINLMKVNRPNWSENKLETYDDYASSEFWMSLGRAASQDPHNKSHAEF